MRAGEVVTESAGGCFEADRESEVGAVVARVRPAGLCTAACAAERKARAGRKLRDGLPCTGASTVAAIVGNSDAEVGEAPHSKSCMAGCAVVLDDGATALKASARRACELLRRSPSPGLAASAGCVGQGIPSWPARRPEAPAAEARAKGDTAAEAKRGAAASAAVASTPTSPALRTASSAAAASSAPWGAEAARGVAA
mmetsp:Transcript_96250/g.310767  ORF Transcript_96250/g.310767 Transcript_96250/m.310767 type:complete len:198 (-) Transcript_96250:665-1258(-)